MNVLPGIQAIGVFRLSLNQSKAVVIWCPLHQEWVTAANSSRHFTNSFLHPELNQGRR